MSLENEIVVSPAPGTYVLVLRCSSNRTIRVGCLGSIRLRPGYYLYVGSGFGPGGLRARIDHHRTQSRAPALAHRLLAQTYSPGICLVSLWCAPRA